MSKLKKAVAYLLIISVGVFSTGCLGSFKLTNVTYQYNQTIGSKWVNELIFILFIPVYAITFLIDGLVLNSIEFWTDRPGYSLKEGEQKKISSKDGKTEYLLTRKKDGYHLVQLKGSKQNEEAHFKYEEASKTWFMVKGTTSTRLVQLVETEQGPQVKVFREDGSSVLVDATLTDRDEILSRIQGHSSPAL